MPAVWNPQANAIFLQVLEQPPAEREAFLQQACSDDAALAAQVRSLLAASEQAGSFLEAPPTEVQSALDTAREEGMEASTLDFLSPTQRPDALGRLGHYEILAVVGSGGFGVVLKAFDEQLQRVVAIKALNRSLAASATARRRFVREARAAAAINHENVVHIHAVDETGAVPYLVMEYVAGASLDDKLKASGPPGIKEILRIGMQIASGLAAAHKQGLVHRDVKPANILLENGVERVKITDFGLARTVDDITLTQTGMIAGTPSYMSPEQAHGQPVDHRSDLFSLGSVLYAMCTGRLPFRAESTMATLRRVCEDTPRPIRDINPEIPEWLVAIIERLLAKQPAERFQTAAEVADLLGQHLAELQRPGPGANAAPRPASNSEKPKPRIRLRSLLVAAAALVVLLLGISLTEATGLTHFAPTLLRIVTGEGTLLVEVNDPAVKITVEGDGGLVITGAGLHEVHLKPGKYQLRADKDGQRVPLNQELVTIIRGKEEVVRVRLESPATARPAATVPLDPARPFVVLSPAGAVKQQLAGLQAALSEAASGDIIEICGDGPYLTPPSSAAGKALSIRAGIGFRPVLRLDLAQVGPEAKVTMLRTTAPLVVEGIEFHVYRSGLLPAPKINAPLGQCTCLQADTAPLRVANCRFLGLGNVLAIDAHYTPDLEIRNSLLLSGNNALFAYLRGPAQVRIENNLILADIAPLRMHVDGRQPDQTSVSITRNTLLGYYAITWLVHEWETSLEAQSKSATRLSRCEVAENLCCSQVTQALFNSCFDSDRPVKPRQPNPDELQQALRSLIEWHERDNGYSDHPLSSGQLVSTTDVSGKMHLLATTLADWNAFWGLKDTGSAVGAVRFIEGDVQQLLRASKESLLPASFLLKNDSFGYRADKNEPNLGADVSLVGPGTAYEQWQATPAYEEWRRTTNQTGQARAESRRSTNQAAAATPREPAGRAAETGAFVVLGGKAFEQKFDTLAEAVRKSGEGDTIEIRGNGPFATEPIKLSSRRTIRAGQGFRPIITTDAIKPPIPGIGCVFDTNAPLILEGLEIQGDDDFLSTRRLEKYAVMARGAPLYVTNCRFTKCVLDVYSAPACQLRNSQFSTARSYAVQYYGQSVAMDNNILATAYTVPLRLLRPENADRMRITRNVFTAGTFTAWVPGVTIAGIHITLSLPREGQTAGPTQVHLSHNIVSPGGILRCSQSNTQADSPPMPLEAAELERLLRDRISWHEEQNIYPTGTPLLSLLWSAKGGATTPLEPMQPLKSLAEWNQFWSQSDTGSIQGAARFQGGDAVYSAPYTLGPDDFRLRSDSAGYRAGPGGKDLGPDIDLVGPGAAYERWKQTPEYQQWLKDTGQLRAEIPQAQAGAFVIPAGKGIAERKFDTLAEAVLKSSEGDTIEIRGNGPFVTPQLTIATARTIRAGAGYRPVIQAARDVESARPPYFVVAREPLTLEGLEVQGPATGGSECTCFVQDAPCYVANCRFRRCALTVLRARGCQVRNSHFSTACSPALYVSTAVPGPTHVVDNNLLTTSLAASGPGARIEIRRNLVLGPQLGMAVAASNPSREQLPVGLHTFQNIFVGSPVFRFSEMAARPLRTTAASGAELEAVLRAVVNWREDGNLYSEGAQFLALHCATGRTSGGGFVFASVEPTRQYRTLSEWNEFWGQSNTGATQGRAQFQAGDAALAAPLTLEPDDFRLRPESAGYRAGPDGKDLGPDIDFVGPGPAYERWKTTPEYEQWLKETGQSR